MLTLIYNAKLGQIDLSAGVIALRFKSYILQRLIIFIVINYRLFQVVTGCCSRNFAVLHRVFHI